MRAEPLRYRARKWAVQQISDRLDRGTQLDRLETTEWDVVVVLDACRWDTLRDVTDWPVGKARSPGSATAEWLAAVEESGVFEDAYIATGNANYTFFDLGAAEITPVWETDWNERLGTVLPEPVLDRADEFLTADRRPVVAHLMPPHAPYVARIDDNWLPAYPRTDAWSHVGSEEATDDETTSAQVAMASGDIDLTRARQAYIASVRSTWETLVTYVGDWVDRGLSVVVTADHGEAFGHLREFGLYGHPNRCHVRPLVEVPFERFSRPEVDDGVATSVEEKLDALGYA